MNVYVVTNPELGWDCVVAVYDSETITEDELKLLYPDNEYVIHPSKVRYYE